MVTIFLLRDAFNVYVTCVCIPEFGSVWEIDGYRFATGCTLFTGAPGGTKFTVAPESAMVSCLVI